MPRPTLRERRAEWRALPFQHYGTCKGCRRQRYIAGNRHDAMRCETCATSPAAARALRMGQGVLFDGAAA